MTVTFELDGQQFIALNGGPNFTFNEAISLEVDCESQEEVDRYWDALTDGGEAGRADGSGPLRRLLADRPEGALRADRRPRP